MDHPAHLRREYRIGALTEATAADDPIEQFRRWFHDASAAGLCDPNAMTLATATRDGRPSARLVLLKHFDADGFVFYTSYSSRKSDELAANPRAALVFWWAELERQVRIEGCVTRVTPAESDAYFASRPLGARLGACASPQSRVIASRAELEDRVRQVEARFPGGLMPRPPDWGGFRLRAECIEFWQGRENRLHDRLRYRLEPAGWTRERLAP